MTKIWHTIISWYEDWQDLRAARKVLKKGKFISKKGKFVSWEDFEKELDL